MADQSSWQPLLSDDFEIDTGYWNLSPQMSLVTENGNRVLQIDGSSYACLRYGLDWSDYAVTSQFRLVSSGNVNFTFRDVGKGGIYAVNMWKDGVNLYRQFGDFAEIVESDFKPIVEGVWHQLRLVAEGGEIGVYVDNELRIAYTDSQPALFGTICFGNEEDSVVFFDDISVIGVDPESKNNNDKFPWIRTGGPNGGVGYDIRFHPSDPKIMFVTDNPSGVNKSTDGGQTWKQSNKGIDIRAHAQINGAPIFSLTIDPNNPDIIWAGTQNFKGIFQSVDGGESWVKKDKGIEGGDDVSFRGFAIHPNDSNIVVAAAEIKTPDHGILFGKSKGKIFESADQGDNWTCVWEGDSLARVVLFNPIDPKILYASTGFWDVESYNDVGVGVLKSTDGGKTWNPINKGLGSLYIGFLDMHPSDPDILIAAAGGQADKHAGDHGIYLTTDGGSSWNKIYTYGGLPIDFFSIAGFSPSNPDILYAANDLVFARSEDGGRTWTEYNDGFGWGPPGIRSGPPIGIAIHPDNPMNVFVNSYTGGNFITTDGGESWINASKGYTGAELTGISIAPNSPDLVYTIGRSGQFKSLDFGANWEGLAIEPARQPEWWTVAVHPLNGQEVLISDQLADIIFKSTNGGATWQPILEGLDYDELSDGRSEGFKAIAYSSSNPNIVYAGAYGFKLDLHPKASLGMYKSEDGGENWMEINNGLDSPLLNINCIAVHPENSNTLYIGTWQDGVFKSTDGGASWQPASNGLLSADVRSLAIDPMNPMVIYAGLGGGVGIMKTTDGGGQWVEINDGMAVACPSYLLSAGQVKGGISFEEPKMPASSLYGLVPWTSVEALAIDPLNPQVIFAGDLSFGVYRSADGGASWHPVNAGLTARAVKALAMAGNGTLLYAAVQGGGVFRLNACLESPVKADDDTYDSIQFALDDVSVGGEATLRLQSILFEEKIYFERNTAVTLSGGYDCGFSVQGPPTTIDGGLEISKGLVTVSNIVLQ